MTDSTFSILELAATRNLPRRTLPAGDKLFLKGDEAAAMYVVSRGSIEVLLLGRVLEEVGVGGIVGEMAMIDGNARCAAALTQAETEVIAIDQPAFLELARSEPRFALEVLAVLARRLRTVTAAQ